MDANGEIRVGISGWRYGPWRGVFYPDDLPRKKELWFASRALPTLEINGTFYSLQRATSFASWDHDTPGDFVFAVKGPRFVTHMLKLRGAGPALANFFASGVLLLGAKLGPFLWQLPPNFRFHEDVLRDFFAILPRTTRAARACALRAKRVAPAVPARLEDRPLRHAIEVRHESFVNPDFVALLREANVALVFADSGGKWPYLEDVTSDFIYVRLHGPEELYSSGYDDPTLAWWADRMRSWRSGGAPRDALTVSTRGPSRRARDVYVYFDNDAKVHAPFDAQKLAGLLGSVARPAAA